MPTISPNLIPVVSPGSLFNVLTTDTSINIRWLTPNDPVLFEALNRPSADIAVRQLIIAKALDQLNLRLSHQANFPFLIPAKVDVGTSELFLPTSWIWDLHASLPKKWEQLRLTKIKRRSGSNSTTDGFTGQVRLIFSGREQNSSADTSLFYADYTIESNLSFQIARVNPVTTSEEADAVGSGEVSTIGGFIIFRTLDTSDSDVQAFFEGIAPPTGGTDADSDGIFDAPAEYDIVDTPPGGETQEDDFSMLPMDHGTGTLVSSAWNAIPSLDSDANTWLTTFNYPFRIEADRESSSPIVVTIPLPLFTEFNLCVPCGDEPTGDISGEFSPVWVSKIRRCDDTSDKIEFFFATYNVKSGSESTTPIEFATLTLQRDFDAGRIVAIEPINDLLLADEADEENFLQGFGRGHVKLSTLWGGTSDDIDDFFDAFSTIVDDPADVIFTKDSTIIGAPGTLSRYSRTTPTVGQSAALAGTTSRRDIPVNPSDSNRYVTEQDQGLGDTIDFRDVSGFTSNPDIDEIAYAGSLTHKNFVLIVDSNGDNHNYNDDILPRIRHILGRDPVFGDVWFDGTRFKTFAPNGTWLG